MNMKIRNVLACLCMMTSFSSFAGGDAGNGGGAFVCRNTNNEILSAELVDFYEGKTEYHLSIKQTNLEVESQLNKAVLKYISSVPVKASEILESIEQVQKIMHVVSNARLENTNDFNLRVSPKSCLGGFVKFEQLANFTNDGQLMVDQEIYEALSNTDKAGLVLHEAAYLLARKWRDVVSSREARRLTAHLFSNLDGTTISKDILDMNLIDHDSNKKWVCSALIIQADYKEELSSRNCLDRAYKCFKKENVQKEILTSYGSTVSKANELLNDKVRTWNPYSLRSVRSYRNTCGVDSGIEIMNEISELNYSQGPREFINCQRPWSVNFDCKQLKFKP
jgi:hypothetical protein